MKKVLILAAVAALAITGCSKDQQVGDTGNETIGFRAVTDKGTRASEITTASLAGFRTYAYWDEMGGTGATASLIPNFMYGIDVTKSGSDWLYSPTKFWPTTGKVHFYAYSPGASTSATFALAQGTAGLPNVTYTVKDAAAAQEDFIIAKAEGKAKAVTPPTPAVAVTFNHALSQVVFKAKSTKEELKFDISKIELVTLYPTGTINLRSADSPVWSNLTGTKKTYEYPLDATKKLNIPYHTTDFVDVTGTDGTLMVMPQPLTGGSSASYDPSSGSYIRVTYGAKDASTGAEIVAPGTVVYKPLNLTLEAGKKYTIELSMSGVSGNGSTDETDAIKFTASVNGWDGTGASTSVNL